MKFLSAFGFLFILIICSQVLAETELKRLAFGSCNKQFLPQPLWNKIIKDSPDLFIHGGDNVYGDSKDLLILKAAYHQQLSIPEYQEFRKKIPVIGIWDDHDFGYNDADGTSTIKAEGQKIFLDFIGEPVESERRQQEGIYTSYSYGKGQTKIKIILLDNRYFRNLEKSAPLLGSKQWQWLEEELKKSDASLHFIVSGISILSPQINSSDEWADYPGEQKRLLELFKTYKPKGLLLFGGDKHFATIINRLGHLEFVSSGMTHNRPWYYRLYLQSFYKKSFFIFNYGLIDIEWSGNNPRLKLAVKNSDGNSVLEEKYQWLDNKWLLITL